MASAPLMKVNNTRQQGPGSGSGPGPGPGKVRMTLDVPLCLVGWIIGRGGCKLQEIQRQSQCRVWMNQNLPDDMPRQLTFEGQQEEVNLAFYLAQQILESAPLFQQAMGGGSASSVGSGSGSGSGSGASTDGSTTLTEGIKAAVLDCPCHLLGLLIGKNGWTLKRISSSTGAKITINQSVLEGQPKRIIIYGQEDQVLQAGRYVQRILSKGSESKGRRRGPGKLDQQPYPHMHMQHDEDASLAMSAGSQAHSHNPYEHEYALQWTYGGPSDAPSGGVHAPISHGLNHGHLNGPPEQVDGQGQGSGRSTISSISYSSSSGRTSTEADMHLLRGPSSDSMSPHGTIYGGAGQFPIDAHATYAYPPHGSDVLSPGMGLPMPTRNPRQFSRVSPAMPPPSVQQQQQHYGTSSAHPHLGAPGGQPMVHIVTGPPSGQRYLVQQQQPPAYLAPPPAPDMPLQQMQSQAQSQSRPPQFAHQQQNDQWVQNTQSMGGPMEDAYSVPPGPFPHHTQHGGQGRQGQGQGQGQPRRGGNGGNGRVYAPGPHQGPSRSQGRGGGRGSRGDPYGQSMYPPTRQQQQQQQQQQESSQMQMQQPTGHYGFAPVSAESVETTAIESEAEEHS